MLVLHSCIIHPAAHIGIGTFLGRVPKLGCVCGVVGSYTGGRGTVHPAALTQPSSFSPVPDTKPVTCLRAVETFSLKMIAQ